MNLKCQVSDTDYKNSSYFGRKQTELYGIFRETIKTQTLIEKIKELNILGYALTFNCKYLTYDIINLDSTDNNLSDCQSEKIRIITTLPEGINLQIKYSCIGCEHCKIKNDI